MRRPTSPAVLTGLAVGLLTAIGLALRLHVAHESLFADELSTYWIVTAHSLGGVVSTVHTDAEIAPPLPFVLSWLSSRISHAPELVRLPSLVAGTATIPLVYLLGLRTVGRAAALAAAALTTFAPFMVYYSAEARGYGVMMAFTALSTLAMLLALDTGRARWWGVYALATAASAYSHYTCVFALGAQLAWLLVTHREARRPALIANGAAVVLYLPWVTGLLNDFSSPTSKILSALSPFNPHQVRVVLEHWSIGYPYSNVAPLRELPGDVGLVLLGIAVVLGAVGAWRRRGRPGERLWLVLAVLLVVPLAEGAVSLVSTHLFSVRNLAPAWPFLALALGALLVAAGPRLRWVAAPLAVVALALGSLQMLRHRFERPDYRAAAAFVDSHAAAGDVLVDGTAVLSPGPPSGLDPVVERGLRTFRADAPQESGHPFTVFDPVVTAQQAVNRAVAAARGGKVFVVTLVRPAPQPRVPAPYRLADERIYRGILDVRVREYSR